jgi:hypothetical protein
LRIVNGYVCQTGCDVRVARQGIDPENLRRDPVKQAEIDAERALRTGRIDQAAPGTGLVGGATANATTARLVDRLA